MKIAILTERPTSYSVTRLKTTAETRGHQVRSMSPCNFSLEIQTGRPQLYYKEKKLQLPDAVIPRIAHAVTFVGTSVVRQFEQMGVFTLNTAQGISSSRDKLRALQILSRHEVGITASQFEPGPDGVLRAIERMGGVPVIIKVLEGSQGVGVILAENAASAQAIVETLHGANKNVLIQKFVSESRGRDVRAIVVGGRVIAAMRRRAVGDEYRSNVHRGGTTEAVELTPTYEAAAIRAAQILGLRVAGVDLLEGSDGPLVMEVNSSPGLEGIEAATNVDVAEAIIQHLEDQVMFPEIDIQQRLKATPKYAVAEVEVKRTSRIRGMTIREARLLEHEVRVLSVTRKDEILQLPSGDEKLLAKDKLLCYGELEALKRLMRDEEATTITTECTAAAASAAVAAAAVAATAPSLTEATSG